MQEPCGPWEGCIRGPEDVQQPAGFLANGVSWQVVHPFVIVAKVKAAVKLGFKIKAVWEPASPPDNCYSSAIAHFSFLIPFCIISKDQHEMGTSLTENVAKAARDASRPDCLCLLLFRQRSVTSVIQS